MTNYDIYILIYTVLSLPRFKPYLEPTFPQQIRSLTPPTLPELHPENPLYATPPPPATMPYPPPLPSTTEHPIDADDEGNRGPRHEPVNEVAYKLEADAQIYRTHRRELMKKKHDGKHNVVTFRKGDFATIAIHGNDRTSLDYRRMLVKIIDVPRQDTYKLLSIHGVLDRNVKVSSLNEVGEDLSRPHLADFDAAPLNKVITIHQAGHRDSISDKIDIACNCAKSCKRKKCPCFKNDRSCSQYCHGGDDDTCNNLPDTIIDRTESALIDNQSKLFKSKRKRAATISSPKEHRQTKKPSRQLSPPQPPSDYSPPMGQRVRKPTKKGEDLQAAAAAAAKKRVGKRKTVVDLPAAKEADQTRLS